MTAPEMDAPTLERMRPLWAEFADALRVDPALLVEFAEYAREVAQTPERDRAAVAREQDRAALRAMSPQERRARAASMARDRNAARRAAAD
jgi:hypothetical protein